MKPGSICARLESVLTTSPLFIYSCKQRSIRFWTCKNIFLLLRNNRWLQSKALYINCGHSNIHNRINSSYKFNVFTRNLFIIITRSWYRTRISSSCINDSCIYLFSLLSITTLYRLKPFLVLNILHRRPRRWYWITAKERTDSYRWQIAQELLML